MELLFEHTAQLGPGNNPAAVHVNDNNIYLFGVVDGRLMVREWQPPAVGDVPWDAPDFGEPFSPTLDRELSLYRMKNVPRVGIFGAWHQGPVAEGENIITPERHRFAIWHALNDVSKYLDSGSFQLDINNMVSGLTLTLKNPGGLLSGEDSSRILPGMKIELFFRAGDSKDYPFGVFYVDRTAMSTDQETVTVEARNMSGKMLKDQTFDALNVYPADLFYMTVVAILENAGVTDYDVQTGPQLDPPWKIGMEFPPDMDMLTGLLEFAQCHLNYRVVETLDGKIIAGSQVSYEPMRSLNSRYTFVRGSEVFSRSIVRDDKDAYAKVCCQSTNSATGDVLRAYAAIENQFGFVLVPQKTLYVDAADDMVLADLEDLAEELAGRLQAAGVVETFTGPFRPHLTRR